RVWSDEHRLETWLRVEIAAAEAWHEVGAIPDEAIARIRAADFDPHRYRALLAETHHDMIAFVRAVAERLGAAGRFVHLGLTSSDVLDTGLALQLREAAELLERDLDGLEAVVAELAIRHKYT